MFDNISIFYSYAHEDERLRKKLEKHLALLQNQGLITTWYDRKISAGTEWTSEISSRLDAAQIILLLVSPSFLASKYCYGSEMTRALERHNAGTARVIPIILRPVYWEGAPFSKLQALPTDAKPITGRGWRNIDEAFADVAQGINRAVEELRSQNSSTYQLSSPFECEGQLLSSHVILIDASLDPHDSPYEQKVEDGLKKIRYKKL
jgi:TIR domain-containing protein